MQKAIETCGPFPNDRQGTQRLPGVSGESGALGYRHQLGDTTAAHGWGVGWIAWCVLPCCSVSRLYIHEEEKAERLWGSPVPHSWSTLLLSEGAQIESSDQVVSCCEAMLQRLEEVSPQLGIDGLHNIWIIKPGAKSRGRGRQVRYSRTNRLLGCIVDSFLKYINTFNYSSEKLLQQVQLPTVYPSKQSDKSYLTFWCSFGLFLLSPRNQMCQAFGSDPQTGGRRSNLDQREQVGGAEIHGAPLPGPRHQIWCAPVVPGYRVEPSNGVVLYKVLLALLHAALFTSQTRQVREWCSGRTRGTRGSRSESKWMLKPKRGSEGDNQATRYLPAIF